MNKLFRELCRFETICIGGVLIDEISKKLCLHYLGLENLFKRLFPVYKSAEVLDCCGSRETSNMCCYYIKSLVPVHTFYNSPSIQIPFTSRRELTPGTKIVLKTYGTTTYGLSAELHEILSRASSERLEKQKQFDLSVIKNDERTASNTTDPIYQTLAFERDRAHFQNFCQFAQNLIQFLTLSFDELINFAIEEMFADNVPLLIESLMEDVRIKEIYSKIIVNDLNPKLLLRKHPAIMYRLVYLQTLLARHFRLTKVIKNKTVSRSSLWRITLLHLIQDDVKQASFEEEHQVRRIKRKLADRLGYKLAGFVMQQICLRDQRNPQPL